MQKGRQSAFSGYSRGRKITYLERIADVLVMSPAELIASKVISYYQRRGRPKSGTDWRDIALCTTEFPNLKEKGLS
ncbi:MAG: hypothetical protein R2911_13580 [Caldilineaceae bacterium]